MSNGHALQKYSLVWENNVLIVQSDLKEKLLLLLACYLVVSVSHNCLVFMNYSLVLHNCGLALQN